MAIRDLAYLQVLGLPLDVNRPQGPDRKVIEPRKEEMVRLLKGASTLL